MTEDLPDIVVKEEKKPEVFTNQKGQLVAKDIEGLWRLAKAIVDSGMAPKQYQTPNQVLIGLQYAISIGLAPSVAALNNISVINGQPGIWGELPLKLVRESGELEFIHEYLIDQQYEPISVDNKNLDAEPFAAVCEIQRKGHEKKKFYWTVLQQKKSGGGMKAIWNQYFEIMMKRKARSIAIKDEFGDVIGPMKIGEYDHNQMPEKRDVTPMNQANVADKFDSMFGGDDE